MIVVEVLNNIYIFLDFYHLDLVTKQMVNHMK